MTILLLLQDFVTCDNAFQYMMQFPLLKMQHYRLIVGKLHNTLQMTEVNQNVMNCNLVLFMVYFVNWGPSLKQEGCMGYGYGHGYGCKKYTYSHNNLCSTLHSLGWSKIQVVFAY